MKRLASFAGSIANTEMRIAQANSYKLKTHDSPKQQFKYHPPGPLMQYIPSEP